MTDRRHPFRQSFDRLTDPIVEYFRRSRRGPRFPGDLRRIEKFESRLLERRDVLVYLPPGYQHDTARRYPVLYMHDGQNLFDPRTAFMQGQHWRAGETIGGMITRGLIEPLIVIGIYNTGEKRIDEYTPTRDPEQDRGGAADHYGEMIINELKPHIDRDYRTLRDRANTAIAGSSLGGLVSIYLAMKRPDVFGRVGALSPSVWWGDKIIVKTVEGFHASSRPRIWVDIGTSEADGAVEHVRQLVNTLRKKGWKEGDDLRYVEIPGGQHNEAAWAARIGDVLRFLFRPPPRVESKRD